MSVKSELLHDPMSPFHCLLLGGYNTNDGGVLPLHPLIIKRV